MKKIERQVEARLNRYEEVGVAGLRPTTTHVNAYIEIRPAPDDKHKQPSIRIRMNDAKFKERLGTVVISIEQHPKVIAGGDRSVTIDSTTWSQIEAWIHLNQVTLTDYWTSEEVFTDDVLKKLKPLSR